MVLEPVEDVLALDLAVLAEAGRDPLDLVGGGGPDAVVVVEVLEDPYLVRRGRPPRTALPANVTAAAAACASSFRTAVVVGVAVHVFLVLMLLLFSLLLGFHEGEGEGERETGCVVGR